jgi:hypothetical protein
LDHEPSDRGTERDAGLCERRKGAKDASHCGRGNLPGPRRARRPLEVLGIQLADRDLLVVHAMRLLPKDRDAFERLMEWDEP